MMLYVISIGIITVLAHFLIYVLKHFDRKKYEEKRIVDNIATILSKIEEPNGGKNMNEDMKKLAKYLANKIEECKEEMLSRLDELEESIAQGDTTQEYEDDEATLIEETGLDDFEELDDIKEKKIPDSLKIEKRQIFTTGAEDKKEEKRGLFKKSKQNEQGI